MVAARSAPRTRKESFGTEKKLICDDTGSRTARVTFARAAPPVGSWALSRFFAAAISLIVSDTERKDFIAAAAGKTAPGDPPDREATLVVLEAAIALFVISAHTSIPVRNVKIFFI